MLQKSKNNCWVCDAKIFPWMLSVFNICTRPKELDCFIDQETFFFHFSGVLVHYFTGIWAEKS